MSPPADPACPTDAKAYAASGSAAGASADPSIEPGPEGRLVDAWGTRSAQLRRGTGYGIAAYVLWGLFPFYFHALSPAGPVEIVAHRILWCLAFCVLALGVRRDWRWIRGVFARGRLLVGLTVAAGFIAVNWGVYVGAVLSGHTRDAALGYFLNPLLTVALGVLVLREPLRRLQGLAVAIGGLAAAYLTVVNGTVPVIALTLAGSFALYALIKNRVGANLPALQGLTIETAVLAPLALAVLGPLSGWLAGVVGTGAAGWVSPGHATLLVLSGPITAVPLLLFAAAARRVPLVTVGLLQFISPVLQLISSLMLGERIGAHEWLGFVIVWVALGVLTADVLRDRRRSPATG